MSVAITTQDWGFDIEDVDGTNPFEYVSDSAKDFISQCMIKNPKSRLSVASAINMKFIKNVIHVHGKQLPLSLLDTKNTLSPNVRKNVKRTRKRFKKGLNVIGTLNYWTKISQGVTREAGTPTKTALGALCKLNATKRQNETDEATRSSSRSSLQKSEIFIMITY